MASAPLPLEASPIAFGTDGWRGILGVDITVERLLPVAAAAARELEASAPQGLGSREVVLGYDRRFLAQELAAAIAAAVRGADLEPVLSDSPTPTPASSWAVVERGALGALVITASHNPPEWLGLKIKGPFGGSVEGDFTARVERRLAVQAAKYSGRSKLDLLQASLLKKVCVCVCGLKWRRRCVWLKISPRCLMGTQVMLCYAWAP